MLLWVLDPAGKVVDEDELDEGGVDEEHADPVPEVHGGQVGDHGQLGAEPGDMFVKHSTCTTAGSLLKLVKKRLKLLFVKIKSLLVGGGEEVEHGGHAEGDAGRLRVPLDPECDEGGCDQDHACNNRSSS